MAQNHLKYQQNFHALSAHDLMEARDLYHVHWMRKRNVFATAVGLYRIRKSEDWPNESRKSSDVSRGAQTEPRTLSNSEVRPYSWPCVLVFVSKWVQWQSFRKDGELSPEDMVPASIAMADGRVVPVCVIQADAGRPLPPPAENLVFPSNAIGGGYPVIIEVQGEERVASMGCLVTDGRRTYAMTNLHVAGSADEPTYSLLGGERVLIGRSSRKHLGKLPFDKVFPEWPGRHLLVNLDVGLIDVTNVQGWTAQVYGIGKLNAMVDLHHDNLDVNIIGCRVQAYGCASRRMRGEITALFYRYQAAGGFETVADFLIGPRPEGGDTLQTHPGDSGTLWVTESDEEEWNCRPIAIQWGGQVIDGGSTGPLAQPYALATCLSNVCRLLDVQIVRDWNDSLPEYWGAFGHYSLASMACGAVRDKRLRGLLNANLDRISFPIQDIDKNSVSGLSNYRFVPLADVPDLVWKKRGGEYSRGQEGPSHFADMDKPDSNGRSLLDLCHNESSLTVQTWQGYYKDVGDESRGLLPFRVWQIFDAMLAAVRGGNAPEFLCAAGVLSHYVADACMPLHITYLFNGDSAETEGVHKAFDKEVPEYHALEIKEAVPRLLEQQTEELPDAETGRQAGFAVVELMKRTLERVPPRSVVDAFSKCRDLPPKKRAQQLWQQFGPQMLKVMADGCRCLAGLWQSAWQNGGNSDSMSLAAVSEDVLIQLYQDEDFLPSRNLGNILPFLKVPPGQIETPRAKNVRKSAGASRRRGSGRPRGSAGKAP